MSLHPTDDCNCPSCEADAFEARSMLDPDGHPGLCRCLAPPTPEGRLTEPYLLACDQCGAVMNETMNTRSESDRCGIVYSPDEGTHDRFVPCGGRLWPVSGVPPTGEQRTKEGTK